MLRGTSGPDVIAGLQGNDVVRGLGGDDVICAGRGDDAVYGGKGFDVMFGAQGNDTTYFSNGRSATLRTDTAGGQGWTPDRLGSQAGKTFLITGGNSGIGFEASRILLGKGAKVVMLNRSAERSDAAVAKLKDEFGSEAEVSFVRMDLASLDSVRTAAAAASWWSPAWATRWASRRSSSTI